MPEETRITLGGDYYRVLGVSKHASAHEIHRAYRRLARQHHPDISGHAGAADRFNAVSEAYEVLHDPDQRARYDHHHGLSGSGTVGAVDGNDAGRRGQPGGPPGGPVPDRSDTADTDKPT